MFFVSTLRQAYNDLADKVQQAPDQSFSGAKTDIVKDIILEQTSDFSLAGIEHLCPSISVQLIKKELALLKADGVVKLEGRGRGQGGKKFEKQKKSVWHGPLIRGSCTNNKIHQKILKYSNGP